MSVDFYANFTRDRKAARPRSELVLACSDAALVARTPLG
jgi:hypothetical protein